MFWKTKELRTVVQEPLNTKLIAEHTKLLAEHRQLLANYVVLIETLRATPHWANPSATPLYRTEEEEDAIVHDPGTGRRLSVVPDFPNPFEDVRDDEAVLANLGLDTDFHN